MEIIPPRYNVYYSLKEFISTPQYSDFFSHDYIIEMFSVFGIDITAFYDKVTIQFRNFYSTINNEFLGHPFLFLYLNTIPGIDETICMALVPPEMLPWCDENDTAPLVFRRFSDEIDLCYPGVPQFAEYAGEEEYQTILQLREMFPCQTDVKTISCNN